MCTLEERRRPEAEDGFTLLHDASGGSCHSADRSGSCSLPTHWKEEEDIV